MEDFIFTYALKVQNVGRNKTFVGHQSREGTIIDLTLTRGRVEVQNWRVRLQYSGSDHNWITFEVEDVKKKSRKVRDFSKCDWSCFGIRMLMGKDQEEWPEQPVVWGEQEIEDEVTLFYERLNYAMEICPLVEVEECSPLSCWSDELQESRRNVRLAYHELRQCWTEEKLEVFKDKRKVHKKKVRKARREEWKSFCNNTPHPVKAAKLNKIIQDSITTVTLGMVRRRDGTVTEDEVEMAETMLDEHFPESSLVENESIGTQRKVLAPYYEWLSEKAFTAAVDKFGNNKAPGPDGIKPIVLKKLPAQISGRLLRIYAACLDLGYVPMEWRRSKVIFIPKAGKDDYSDPRAFRPISLTSFVFKTMERMVLWHLEGTSLKRLPLHRNQHAFRRDNCTEMALSKLVAFVEEALRKKEIAVGVFLDIEGAYDNVSTEAMMAGNSSATFRTLLTVCWTVPPCFPQGRLDTYYCEGPSLYL